MVNLKYVSVNINEIKGNNYRLEASVFNIEARNAKEILQKCKFPIVPICGENGLATAFVVGRFKRNYIDAKVKGALGFLGSSEMLELRPAPHKFMVADKKFENFKVQEGWLLISCSGTIGKPIYVSRTLKNYIFSQHSLRIIPKNNQLAGYLYAYLKTEIGQILVQSNNYGAVIQHIEPEHLAKVPIPNPTDDIKQEIHDLVMQSFELRDKYNELIDKAEKLLKEELQLPPIHELKPKYVEKIRQYSPSITSQDVKAYSVPLKFLENRFDASFHLPIVSEIIDVLLDSAEMIKPLGDLVNDIILPTRFKRYYVEDNEYGMLLIGGKQINELEPSTKKYISIKGHSKQIQKELLIKENTILVTRSGTIGKVTITPKYWENWIPSDHIIRIVPKNKDLAGYLFLWLLSDYGSKLIKKFTYGSVVDEVEPEHIAQIPIPLLKNKNKQKEINDLVLQANQLRTEAFEKEQEAIRLVNEKVIMS